MARKTTRRTSRKPGTARKVAGRGARPRRTTGTAKRRKAAGQGPLRAMADLNDQEKVRVFAAVQQTLLEHGVGNTLAELHFASDELALVCGEGQVRRMVVFRCGPGVCTKNVCVPLS